MVAGRTQPLFSAVRGRPASVGSAFSGWTGLGISAGAGAKGGKAVSAGFNKSVGAATGTVNTLRHLGENRLSLPPSQNPVTPGCVRWLGMKNQGHVAIFGEGTIRIHKVAPSTNTKARKRRSSVHVARPLEFVIPSSFRHDRRSHSDHTLRNQDESHERSTATKGFWHGPEPIHHERGNARDPHPLSYAEIETNAPYQPFHTDHRVGFYIYDNDAITLDSNPASAPWAFGEPIATAMVNVHSTVEEEDSEVARECSAPLENLVSLERNAREGQQFVVTTRRKRIKNRAAGEGLDDTDFFEDDYAVVDFAEDRV